MEPSVSGSLRLFRAAGIDVYLHWSWFLVAWMDIYVWADPSLVVKVTAYVSLFAIVLLHEFGHALACRQVGGQAQRIVLWPLGGLAYVAPPARPGAVLWSIAAGPLVNAVLLLPLIALYLLAGVLGWPDDLGRYLGYIALLNALLLVLNLLPVYPLDGGQILYASLWYVVGRWQALAYVSVAGGILGGALFFGVSFVVVANLFRGDDPVALALMAVLLGLVSAFITLRSLMAYQAAQYMLRLEALPRHGHCLCPGCGTAPPMGACWVCEHCQSRFDTFDTRGKCPACGAWYLETTCPFCRTTHHIDRWFPEQTVAQPLAPRPFQGPPPPSTPPDRAGEGAAG